MLSNQTYNPRTNNSARMFSDDPDKMLLKYVLSQTVREQNNRKLQEHLEKLGKIGCRLPKELEHDGISGYQGWQRRESDLRGL